MPSNTRMIVDFQLLFARARLEKIESGFELIVPGFGLCDFLRSEAGNKTLVFRVKRGHRLDGLPFSVQQVKRF